MSYLRIFWNCMAEKHKTSEKDLKEHPLKSARPAEVDGG